MTTRSSFLPRLSLSRADKPVLPFHNPSSPPLRQSPSEYGMSELSPRPEDRLISSDPSQNPRNSSSGHRSSSSSAKYSDPTSPAAAESETKSRVLFAGPPPPIASSALLYRDEEDATTSRSAHQGLYNGATASFARTALTSVSSVLFERSSPGSSSPHTDRVAGRQAYEPDTIWRNLQRRERTLQRELQHLLDIQSAGLAAHLDPNAPGAPELLSGNRSDASDAGSATPTIGGTASVSSRNTRQQHLERRVAFDDAPGGGTEQVVIPVRQPRQKRIGLGAARVALARNMSILADLKVEEDAVLTAALGTRKKAIAHLRRLAGRREGIVEELKSLEGDGEEPLGRELRELGRERKAVSSEIAELEERLVGLRSRKRWLDGRIEDVKNRKEAGLSGYRNALREVDADISALLKRPPVKPVDVEAMGALGRDEEGKEVAGYAAQSPGGVEFLRLRPERRTVDMAKDWWESEIKILEDRKAEVDRDRKALEDGVQTWKEAIKLVSEFETSLRREMRGETQEEGKGKNKAPTPEEAMRGQLGKMAEVISGLEQHLRTAEDRGWNLLICAIGAELEAFKQAEALLSDALRATGFGDENGDSDADGLTPQLGRSMNGKVSPVKHGPTPGSNNLVDIHDDATTTESDNEVPPDLLVAHEENGDLSPVLRHSVVNRHEEHEDSENDVPAEFLTEHHRDELD